MPLPGLEPGHAVYGRIGEQEGARDAERQLVPLREYVGAQGWETFKEYFDHAAAGDLQDRTAWRELMADAGRGEFDTVLVAALDRVSRNVADAATAVERLRSTGVTIHVCGAESDTPDSLLRNVSALAGIR